MRLGFGRADDVKHLGVAHLQVIGNQCAMAAPPDRFSAHDRGASFCRETAESLDATLKFFRLHVVGIAAERVVSPRGVVRIGTRFSSPAKFTKMFVADSDLA